MPVEIRELIINAEAESRQTDSAAKTNQVEAADIPNAEEIQQLVENTVLSSFFGLKKEMMEEIKMMLAEYREKQERRF